MYDHISRRQELWETVYKKWYGFNYKDRAGVEWFLTGHNDIGVPYFSKKNSKKQYTTQEYRTYKNIYKLMEV